MRHVLGAIALALLCAYPAPAATGEPLTVFAAASLTDVLPSIAAQWAESEGGAEIVFSFDASSRLAPQIAEGAPADLFLSADAEWMDYCAERGLIQPETRRDLIGNTLVCVVPSETTFRPEDAAALDDPALVHLALAGENVPAGKYAQAALTSLGVWEALKDRVVRGSNVRTTLAYVATQEAEAGVVYTSDALAEPKVAITFAFPANTHPPIVYPGAVTTSSDAAEAAQSFLDYCQSPDAQAVFIAYGFTPLASQ